MATITLTKIDAAQRQLASAIRLTFMGEDPVAIHGLVASAHRIIRDICAQRGDVESYLQFTDWIKPGREGEFWRVHNASANFLKHAEKDAGQTHDLDVESADFMIMMATKWFKDLGNAISPEMSVFVNWWALCHPELMTDTVMSRFKTAAIAEQFAKIELKLRGASRADKVRAGKVLLEEHMTKLAA
jgi:hypothetical protein